ncbi:(d)CMP kinase [Christensenellaceae bacterium NSJ-53]|uniref:Cytidylate kinase n=2 Tax=Gehongia tenuis TaxID=2763655 RepID=A0A926HQF3_9FIRM|nr:(d)CMP kinase [Gehongia tenuis]MBC8531201.1 (d)CMP kinase [Gehongia tenuis]
MAENIAVALDGPGGSGKSTIAKMLAKRLGSIYLDTGAMYRTFALKVLRSGLNKSDRSGILKILDETKVDVAFENGEQRMLLDGEDVTGLIREPDVTEWASFVASIPEVRLKLVELQREVSKRVSIVMDGRDIGTYVLPHAQYKFFLTASPEVRAKRRYDESLAKGMTVSYSEIYEALAARDAQDSGRDFAPLRQAEDAILIDTGMLTPGEVMETILRHMNR